MDKALGDTFLDPDLEYLRVPRLRVSQYVLAAGLESEFIGSGHSRLLLETIIRCSIVKFHNLKMTSFVVLLEASKGGLEF